MLNRSIVSTLLLRVFLIILCSVACLTSEVSAYEQNTLWDPELGVELSYFPDTGYPEQKNSNISLRWQLKAQHTFTESTSPLRLDLFARYDAVDKKRTHWDIRELSWDYQPSNIWQPSNLWQPSNQSQSADQWLLRAGVLQQFWGVTESRHLLAVLNQTDLIENIDGEDKLGQPMLNLAYFYTTGAINGYMLPGFRERTFPGRKGRLRMPVKIGDARYQSGAGQKHIDWALRWQHTIDQLDIAIFHFHGTSRDPWFALETPQPTLSSLSHNDKHAYYSPELQPVYDITDLTGLEVQYLWQNWAFKLELLSDSGIGQWDRNTAVTTGFEYTAVNAFNTGIDMGLLVEWLFDDRGNDAPIDRVHDGWFLGTRWTMNNFASTQALLGVIIDENSKNWSLEVEHRLAPNMLLTIESRWFSHQQHMPQSGWDWLNTLNQDPSHKLSFLQQEDYFRAEISWYF
ncbi:hypothetical protein [Zooshikella ganghwensis]|uniref:Porin n=1 Tax=Zooshikella ganghwensis TaxID=202772 RepID=A0A4P9VIN9_9GAMM|nr:hypothetical protein [Zooshikella ganghwensis]RDH42090.1 hypothetical protein B9G39_00780 [Zooshikella ganghwensis]